MEFPALTKERLEVALDALGLQHFRDDDGDVCVGFDAAFFYFRANEHMVTSHAIWKGATADEALGHDMSMFVNHINAVALLGTAVSVMTQDGHTVRVDIPLLVAEGATDEQARDMLDTCFQASFSAFHLLEQQYPQLVTWEVAEDEAAEGTGEGEDN